MNQLPVVSRIATWGAVSYTHLDVYKRQAHCQGRLGDEFVLGPGEPLLEASRVEAIVAGVPVIRRPALVTGVALVAVLSNWSQS